MHLLRCLLLYAALYHFNFVTSNSGRTKYCSRCHFPRQHSFIPIPNSTVSIEHHGHRSTGGPTTKMGISKLDQAIDTLIRLHTCWSSGPITCTKTMLWASFCLAGQVNWRLYETTCCTRPRPLTIDSSKNPTHMNIYFCRKIKRIRLAKELACIWAR